MKLVAGLMLGLSFSVLFSVQAKAEPVNSSEASFFEMAEVYAQKVSVFTAIALKPDYSAAKKMKGLRSFLHYAKNEVENQVGKSGLEHDGLMWVHQSIAADVEQKNFVQAAQNSQAYFGQFSTSGKKN